MAVVDPNPPKHQVLATILLCWNQDCFPHPKVFVDESILF
jgi:hypothetical protein